MQILGEKAGFFPIVIFHHGAFWSFLYERVIEGHEARTVYLHYQA